MGQSIQANAGQTGKRRPMDVADQLAARRRPRLAASTRHRAAAISARRPSRSEGIVEVGTTLWVVSVFDASASTTAWLGWPTNAQGPGAPRSTARPGSESASVLRAGRARFAAAQVGYPGRPPHDHEPVPANARVAPRSGEPRPVDHSGGRSRSRCVPPSWPAADGRPRTRLERLAPAPAHWPSVSPCFPRKNDLPACAQLGRAGVPHRARQRGRHRAVGGVLLVRQVKRSVAWGLLAAPAPCAADVARATRAAATCNWVAPPSLCPPDRSTGHRQSRSTRSNPPRRHGNWRLANPPNGPCAFLADGPSPIWAPPSGRRRLWRSLKHRVAAAKVSGRALGQTSLVSPVQRGYRRRFVRCSKLDANSLFKSANSSTEKSAKWAFLNELSTLGIPLAVTCPSSVNSMLTTRRSSRANSTAQAFGFQAVQHAGHRPGVQLAPPVPTQPRLMPFPNTT